MTVEQFVLVIGNARSGTTIVGSILDSHPAVVCGNETPASQVFWRDYDRDKIVNEIVENSKWNRENRRPSSGYSYAIEGPPKHEHPRVVADKTWNPALLLLAGQPDLIDSLAARMQCPVSLVMSVRNPFDVISTMHRRTAAPLRDRLRWFALNCEALQIIVERDACPIKLVRHEDLVRDPTRRSRDLFEWLGLVTAEDNFAAIERVTKREPNRSREHVEWPLRIVDEIERLCGRFEFLSGYTLL